MNSESEGEGGPLLSSPWKSDESDSSGKSDATGATATTTIPSQTTRCQQVILNDGFNQLAAYLAKEKASKRVRNATLQEAVQKLTARIETAPIRLNAAGSLGTSYAASAQR
jgi:hypothetical protein